MLEEEYFEMMGLPIQDCTSEQLENAYREVRKLWFFRQFEPNFVNEAEDKLKKLDLAYKKIRDERQRKLLVKRIHNRQLIRQQKEEEFRTTDETSKSIGSQSQQVPRHVLIQDCIRQAELITGQGNRALSDEEKQRLVRFACQKGLSTEDATEVIDRLSKHLNR